MIVPSIEMRLVLPNLDYLMAIMIFSTIFLVGFGVYPEPLIKFVELAAPVISLTMP